MKPVRENKAPMGFSHTGRSKGTKIKNKTCKGNKQAFFHYNTKELTKGQMVNLLKLQVERRSTEILPWKALEVAKALTSYALTPGL